MHCKDCNVVTDCACEKAWINQGALPDSCCIFFRIHTNSVSPKPISYYTGFQLVEGHEGMSCDWCRYSTAHETRERAKRNPHLNGVGKVNVSTLRKLICELQRKHKVEDASDKPIEHRPHKGDGASSDNYAHSEIITKLFADKQKLTELRGEAQSRKLVEIVIEIPPKPVQAKVP